MKTDTVKTYYVAYLVHNGTVRYLTSYSGTRSNAVRKFKYFRSCLDLPSSTLIQVCTFRSFDHYIQDENSPVRTTFI